MRRNPTRESNLEQSQESTEPAIALTRADLSRVQHHAEQLITALESVHDGDMVAEIVDNTLKLLRDKTNRGDIKLINKSFNLSYAGADL